MTEILNLRRVEMINRNDTGMHIIGDLIDCPKEYLYALHMQTVRDQIVTIIKRHGFHILGDHFYLFEKGAYTGMVVLSESHVSVHTWPELGVVNIDVYTCNYSADNSEETKVAFQEIADIFEPKSIRKQVVNR